VQATKRVFRFVVIEFWHRADRPPPCRGVTVFARNVQGAVRIPFGFLLSVIRFGRRWCSTVGSEGRGRAGERQQSPERELEQRERIALPPRDTNTYRGGTVEILGLFWGDRRLQATVQLYSCGTVSIFPAYNR
jgi:hypothetical protein